MKGTVYGGIAYFPRHPAGDLHGLLRCIVRTQGITNLTSILRTYDIAFSPTLFNWSVWAESKSIAEQAATELHYGRVMVCPMALQYLSPANYQLVSETLKHTYKAPAAREQIPAPAIGRHLFTPDEQRRCKVCHNFGKDDSIHIRVEFPMSPKTEEHNG